MVRTSNEAGFWRFVAIALLAAVSAVRLTHAQDSLAIGGQGTILGRPISGAPILGGTLEPIDNIPANTAATLTAMAARAGVIFAGQVLSVARHDDLGYVEIRFAVETPVRGVQAGEVYLLREWAGLWSGAPERFGMGQRRLLLLTAPSAAGFSAPVEGLEGSIPLQATAEPPLLDRNGEPAADAGDSTVQMACDLRWVEARSLRVAAPETSDNGRSSPMAWTGWQPAAPLATLPGGQSSLAMVRLHAVLALLRQGVDDHAR